MAALVSRRKEIVSQLENATNAILKGLSSATLLDKVAALENEKASLDYQISQLHSEVSRVSISDEMLETALSQIISDVDTSNDAILSIVYRVEVHEKEIRVWTLLDCSPDTNPRRKISIPATIQPPPPDAGVCAELLVGVQRHQSDIIRTKSSKWERGSDYLFYL